MELDRVETYRTMKKEYFAKEYKSPTKANANINQIETEGSVSASFIDFVRLEKNKEQLLCFNEKINGKSAWILLDSGASKNFVDTKFVEKNHLQKINMAPIIVELADGQKKEAITE
ncbi:9264_t:CDS:2, partial [Acaulospora morrowiae]